MPLTQRLKKRNQSDTVLAASHHDAQPVPQDIHDVKEEVERKLKKAKVSAYGSHTSLFTI